MRITFIFILSCLLSSCYSFNRITIPREDVKANADLTRTIDKMVAKVNEEPLKKTVLLCPSFTLPIIPKTPPVPYDELIAIDSKDVSAIDRIQQKHIDDLRTYIVQLKQQYKTAQAEHASSCSFMSVVK